MAETLFYVLAALSIAFALGVVRARMPLYSVLSLLGAFFCLAAIYLLLGFPFLAATQLLVYAGAIMVLFLFVVMLLNLDQSVEVERHAGLSLSGRRLFVAGASAALLGLVVLASAELQTVVAADALGEGSLDDFHAIATLLFSRYMLPFEAASLLLLATMVAVIVLAKRQRGQTALRSPATTPEAPAAPLASAGAGGAPAGTGGAAR